MKTEIKIPCSLSKKFISYGLFAVLSQLIFIALNVGIILPERGIDIVTYIYLPYLEYPLVSLALVIGGALLFDYINIKNVS